MLLIMQEDFTTAAVNQGKLNAKQKHLGCKKGKANQKQQLSDCNHIYIAIHVTNNFDIRLRPRIS